MCRFQSHLAACSSERGQAAKITWTRRQSTWMAANDPKRTSITLELSRAAEQCEFE